MSWLTEFACIHVSFYGLLNILTNVITRSNSLWMEIGDVEKSFLKISSGSLLKIYWNYVQLNM